MILDKMNKFLEKILDFSDVIVTVGTAVVLTSYGALTLSSIAQ